jgi:mediator of RNA polymerase II transcription subunit 13
VSLPFTESENPRSETPSSSTATNQTTSNVAGNTTPTSTTTNTTAPITATTGPDEEEVEPPAIVVYFVEPFSLGGTEDPDRRRLAILALLRIYSSAINNMPENMRANIHVQVTIKNSV